MDIFSYCHFHNASKECLWPKKKNFKFHARVQNCHFGKIAIYDPVLPTLIFTQQEGMVLTLI